MKALFAILLLASSCWALTWESFVKLSLEEKYLLMNERLKQVENGSVSNPYLNRAGATIMRQWAIGWIPMFVAQNQDGYVKAMANVNEYMKNMTEVATPWLPTKFIKVGDRYVSESVCKADPAYCVEPVANITKNVTAPVKNKRTAAECGAAREKDWAVYCWQNAKTISCDAVSSIDKTMILNNLAQGYYSNQAICLRGE
jgi:hypothetical protein